MPISPLISAETFFFGACEMTDEVLALSIEPDFLQQVALEIDCPHPDRVELLSGFKVRDRQLQSIFQSIQTEIHQSKWGNQLYLDSLHFNVGSTVKVTLPNSFASIRE
jgi:AraC family transcriptional regulator